MISWFSHICFRLGQLVPLRRGEFPCFGNDDDRVDAIAANLVRNFAVGLYESNAVDPLLESAWFQPLKV
jgi:hypothetical protein